MVDIKEKMDIKEAKRIYEENGSKLVSENSSFVSLRNIDKIYPNKVQAVFNFNLEIEKNDFVALVGPSGCGKSTTLRMIAGLEEITNGHLYIDSVLANYLESKDRDIAMVFQSYALYPQLNVYDNIAFGLNIRKMDKKEIEQRVFKAADILDLGPYLDRKPKELSGGQMQRVALGRAIVRNAQLFLMDEPLSNLDAKLRSTMRTELIQMHENLKSTFVYVTHDQVEAMTMADNIVVMDEGVVKQIGTPVEIHDEPSCVFVAQFIGDPGMNVLTLSSGNKVGFRPRNIMFVNEEIDEEDSIYCKGTILARENHGSERLYFVDIKVGKLYLKCSEKSIREVGSDVIIKFPYASCYAFNSDENRIYDVNDVRKVYDEFRSFSR